MYDKKLKEYKARQAEVLQSMQDHSKADQNYHVTASLVLDLAKRAFDIFECSEVAEKRQLINFVFQNMKLLTGTNQNEEIQTSETFLKKAPETERHPCKEG